MFKKLIITPLFFFVILATAQKITIHGYIKDSTNGERLLGASIIVLPANIGATSNNYGFYSITIPVTKDSIEIRFGFVGYKQQSFKLIPKENIKLDLALQSNAVLDEVTVTARRNNPVYRSQMSLIQLQAVQIKNLPPVLGESDVLRAVQLLPGVQAGNEGNAGFYVRGGGADENLILMDGVPVYNAMHLFGFFSVFNSDALQTVDVIKGCLLYTSPSPRDRQKSRMPSSA